MRHRRDADDGPTPGDWDAAAEQAPPARKPRPGRQRGGAPSLKDYLPQDPGTMVELHLRPGHTCAVFHSVIHPTTKTTIRLGSRFHDRRAPARRLPDEHHQYHHHTLATEAVFFEHTIVSRFTPGITIFANIAFVMFCLKQLLHMATAQIGIIRVSLREQIQSREEGQNWNYDFVIVTSIKDGGHKLAG